MKQMILLKTIDGDYLLVTRNEYWRGIRRFVRAGESKKLAEEVRRGEIADKVRLTVSNGQARRKLPA